MAPVRAIIRTNCASSGPFRKSAPVAAYVERYILLAQRRTGWGLLHMKRWGLQWSIIGNLLYCCLWIIYSAAMAPQFDLRFGTSEFGVIGFWLMGGIPFLGPVVLLPYLHSVNRELWSD